jgi:hypothetical protein
MGKKILYKILRKNEVLAMINIFDCEAHREVIITALKSILNKSKG